MSAIPAPRPTVVLGVDTHRDAHVTAALDARSFPTTPGGYAELLTWARSLGDVTRAGVEGTGAYGAALTHALRDAGIPVVDVNRPDRARRRRLGKSDPTDAEHAARAVRAGDATVTPNAQDGAVEALRVLTVARRSAVKARTQAGNQLRCLLVTAPVTLRATLARGTLAACAARCAALRPAAPADFAQACTRALRALARRWRALADEVAELDAAITHLTALAAPRLRARRGIGPQTAATLLIAAGDTPERLRSEAVLAALCGVRPIEASSGAPCATPSTAAATGGRTTPSGPSPSAEPAATTAPKPTKAYIARRTGAPCARARAASRAT